MLIGFRVQLVMYCCLANMSYIQTRLDRCVLILEVWLQEPSMVWSVPALVVWAHKKLYQSVHVYLPRYVFSSDSVIS